MSYLKIFKIELEVPNVWQIARSLFHFYFFLLLAGTFRGADPTFVALRENLISKGLLVIKLVIPRPIKRSKSGPGVRSRKGYEYQKQRFHN